MSTTEPRTDDMLRMGELAEASGVSAATIKHYLREGLLPEPVKTSRNMAYYPAEFVDRIRLIKTLVDREGINLAGVQRLLSIVDVARRLHPLVRETARTSPRAEVHRRLEDEVAALFRLLGLDEPGE